MELTRYDRITPVALATICGSHHTNEVDAKFRAYEMTEKKNHKGKASSKRYLAKRKQQNISTPSILAEPQSPEEQKKNLLDITNLYLKTPERLAEGIEGMARPFHNRIDAIMRELKIPLVMGPNGTYSFLWCKNGTSIRYATSLEEHSAELQKVLLEGTTDGFGAASEPPFKVDEKTYEAFAGIEAAFLLKSKLQELEQKHPESAFDLALVVCHAMSLTAASFRFEFIDRQEELGIGDTVKKAGEKSRAAVSREPCIPILKAIKMKLESEGAQATPKTISEIYNGGEAKLIQFLGQNAQLVSLVKILWRSGKGTISAPTVRKYLELRKRPLIRARKPHK